MGNSYMVGCQNYGPFLGVLNIRCRTIIGIQKGIILLTTTDIIRGNPHSPCNPHISQGSLVKAHKTAADSEASRIGLEETSKVPERAIMLKPQWLVLRVLQTLPLRTNGLTPRGLLIFLRVYADSVGVLVRVVLVPNVGHRKYNLTILASHIVYLLSSSS